MTTIDFAQRHGFRAEPQVLEPPSFLPEDVRSESGLMMVRCFEELAGSVEIGRRHFVHVVDAELPASPEQWEWYRRALEVSGRQTTYSSDYVELVDPLLYCDYRLFYGVVEKVCAELGPLFVQITGVSPLPDDVFADDFNRLLESYGISWRLQSGLVIPADEHEFADELEYVGQVDLDDDVSNPRASLKKAYAALFRKQGGPDITSACFHAWSAWETVREAAGGVNSVKAAYPELWEAVTAWKKLIHAGRHPGTEQDRLPTDDEARFIVGLLTNAVRLMSSPAVTDESS